MSIHDAVLIIRTRGDWLAVRHYCGVATLQGVELHAQVWNGIVYDDLDQARNAAIKLAADLDVPPQNCVTEMQIWTNPHAPHVVWLDDLKIRA